MSDGGDQARIAFLERQVRVAQLLGGSGLLLGALALSWMTLDAWTAPTITASAEAPEWKSAKARAKAKAKAKALLQRGGRPIAGGPRPPAQGGAAVRGGAPELQLDPDKVDSPAPEAP